MPTYEFRCPDHDKVLVTLPVADRNDEQPCAVCDEPMLRVYSIGGVKLKGTGFYSTDIGNLDKQRAQGRRMVERGEINARANLVD